MIEFITAAEIEQLNDEELNYRYFQIFNSLAQRQKALEESSQLISALQHIRSAMAARKRLPRIR